MAALLVIFDDAQAMLTIEYCCASFYRVFQTPVGWCEYVEGFHLFHSVHK